MDLMDPMLLVGLKSPTQSWQVCAGKIANTNRRRPTVEYLPFPAEKRTLKMFSSPKETLAANMAPISCSSSHFGTAATLGTRQLRLDFPRRIMLIIQLINWLMVQKQIFILCQEKRILRMHWHSLASWDSAFNMNMNSNMFFLPSMVRKRPYGFRS